MSGRIVQYKKHEKQGSGRIFVPVSIAQALKWEDGDELNLTIEIIGEQKGIFLCKKKSEV
jgi:bifunctional DNA-binding transcriptional regulator/antitoxin component of YhaV-PrlF toxin-antitoxin module